MKEELLSQLNENQAKAVQHHEGPLLVLAGAGAGKTRVITYRIAYLIEVLKVPAWNILAVTFTNKAAGEMKHRLVQLVGNTAQKVWMGTFHSIGLNILRRFGDKTVAGAGFGVIDQDDRLALVRSILKNLGIDTKKYSPKGYLNHISDYKNSIFYVENRPPEELTHRFAQVFAAYEQELRQQKLIDFDDMLSLSLRLFYQHPDVLDYYRDLCKYILVDEYQDTNVIQFAFLRELAGTRGNICVVGDDDQAIYSWRGAEVENILYFDSHFNGVTEIKLVDNYRSAPEILKNANNLIKNNTARRGKDLVSRSPRTGEVLGQKAMDERYEAEYVADQIENLMQQGVPASEIAILYRTNAQSRNFEVVLNRRKIPYKVVGGVGFYQRREIKDILSYLRVYDNPYDEASFARACKSPPKGVGDTLIEKVRRYALEQHLDLLSAAEIMIPTLPSRQAAGLSILRNMMHNIVTCSKISDMVNIVVEESGYKEYLRQTEETEEAKMRTENIFELYNAAFSFEEQTPEGSLSDFLATATLVTSSDDEVLDTVRLMSIHAAKGLEFEAVFLTGLEEGIFPLSAQDEIDDLEEERRLCYVGVTRAKVFLAMTHTVSRLHHGKRQMMRPSRFLKELGMIASKPGLQTLGDLPADDGTLRKGQTVRHEIFGEGVVMQVSGSGDSAKVDVLFKKNGLKKLVARFLESV